MGSSASFNKDYQINLASGVVQMVLQPGGHLPNMKDEFTVALEKNTIFKEIFKQVESGPNYMPYVNHTDVINVLTKYDLPEIKSFFDELQPFATSEASKMLKLNTKIFTAEIEGITDDDEEFWSENDDDIRYLKIENGDNCSSSDES